MRVIALVSQKGGCGKTTLALGLACCASANGHTTVVVDLDPQASAASWGDRRTSDAPAVLPAQAPRLGRILEAASEQGVDVAYIDTAPRADQSALAAVKAAGLVLVPSRPAIYDLETVMTTVELVRATQAHTPVRCVLNAVPALGRRPAQARALLAKAGVGTCTGAIGMRAVVDHAAVSGQTPPEYEPSGKSAAEFQALYEETCRIVSMPARTN